jgi:hypothetical protein
MALVLPKTPFGETTAARTFYGDLVKSGHRQRDEHARLECQHS